MLLGKMFENLQIAMVILVLFEQFSVQVCLIFSHSLMCFTKRDAFCLNISIYSFLRRKNYCYGSGPKLKKKF